MNDAYAYPYKEAERLYKQFSETEAHVSPMALAKLLGVPVWLCSMGRLKGFYVVVNGLPYIAVNPDMSRQLIDAVCAHELGHHILHRELAESRLLSDYGLYLKSSRLETEANVFACCLLIPDSRLSGLLATPDVQDPPDLPAQTISDLAARAGVPYELMALRLHIAGFPAEVPPSAFLAGPLQ